MEEEYRRQIFEKNMALIHENNEQYRLGNVSSLLSMNEFGDLTSEEFAEKMSTTTTFPISNQQNPMRQMTFKAPSVTKLPDSIDWRTKGAVTEVKTQIKCGACWAFSAAGAVEAQHFKKTGVLVSLSTQNLIDCMSTCTKAGCHGAWMVNIRTEMQHIFFSDQIHEKWQLFLIRPSKQNDAFDYIIKRGINTDEAYPYQDVCATCRYNSTNLSAHIRGFVNIPKGDERSLTAAIATYGPVSVAFGITKPKGIQFYSGGVYYEENCPKLSNHAVLLVGYGVDDMGREYYIAKNSWGANWGIDGYFHIARNRNNHCGIATWASYPVA